MIIDYCFFDKNEIILKRFCLTICMFIFEVVMTFVEHFKLISCFEGGALWSWNDYAEGDRQTKGGRLWRGLLPL